MKFLSQTSLDISIIVWMIFVYRYTYRFSFKGCSILKTENGHQQKFVLSHQVCLFYNFREFFQIILDLRIFEIPLPARVCTHILLSISTLYS